MWFKAGLAIQKSKYDHKSILQESDQLQCVSPKLKVQIFNSNVYLYTQFFILIIIILCAWQVSKALIKCWTMPKGPNIVFLYQALIWFWTKPTIVMQVNLSGSETVRSATNKGEDTKINFIWTNLRFISLWKRIYDVHLNRSED